MADNSGITEIKGKTGISLKIALRYGPRAARKSFTKTIKVSDYPDKRTAYAAARMIRDKARLDIAANAAAKTMACPTVQHFFDLHLEMAGISFKTKKKHLSIYKNEISKFADVPLNEVTSADIQMSLVKYAEEHSNDSIKRVISVWHQLFLAASMSGYDISDKTLILKPVKSKKVTIPKNTATDYQTFLAFSNELLQYNAKDGTPCKHSMDIYYMLWIMYYSGCRTAEALALSAGDYDREGHILRINKSVGSSGSKTRQIVPTKTTGSVRDIPCVAELDAIMLSLLDYSKTSPLLADTDGLPYEIDYVSNYIHLVSVKSGIRFNAYMLRHLFSSSLFASGTSSVVIRDLMGHTSSTMSLDYANASQSELLEALKKRKK